MGAVPLLAPLRLTPTSMKIWPLHHTVEKIVTAIMHLYYKLLQSIYIPASKI